METQLLLTSPSPLPGPGIPFLGQCGSLLPVSLLLPAFPGILSSSQSFPPEIEIKTCQSSELSSYFTYRKIQNPYKDPQTYSSLRNSTLCEELPLLPVSAQLTPSLSLGLCSAITL